MNTFTGCLPDTRTNEEKAKEILEQHLVRGQVLDKYLLHVDENM